MFIAFISIQSTLSGCGGAVDTEKIKDYRFRLNSSDEAIVQSVRSLVMEFNALAQRSALALVEDDSSANSTIDIVTGIRSKTDKIGFGQAVFVTEEDTYLPSLIGKKRTRTITYSMRIELDHGYVVDNIQRKDFSGHWANQKLFFHEVGHGLEMAHDSQNSFSVMFPSIDGNKDFDAFFQSVRRYLDDQ